MTSTLKPTLKLSIFSAVLFTATSELSADPLLDSLVTGPASCGTQVIIRGSDFNQYIDPVVTLTDTVNNVTYQPTIKWRSDSHIAIDLPQNVQAIFQLDIEDRFLHWLVPPEFRLVWVWNGVFWTLRWQPVPGTGVTTYFHLNGLIIATCP